MVTRLLLGGFGSGCLNGTCELGLEGVNVAIERSVLTDERKAAADERLLANGVGSEPDDCVGETVAVAHRNASDDVVHVE